MLVYTLGADGVADNETRLVVPNLGNFLHTNLTELSSFTVCLWFNLLVQMPRSAILSYYISFSLQNALLIRFGDNLVTGTVMWESVDLPVKVSPRVWQLVCLLQNNASIMVYLGGQTARRAVRGGSLYLTGSLVIGNDQDGQDSSYNPFEAFMGDVAGLTIWDLPLSHNDLGNLEQCIPPSVSPITQDPLPWATRGKVTTREGDPCQENHESVTLLIPGPLTVEAGLMVCDNLGLRMAVPKTLEEQGQLTEILVNFTSSTCIAFFTIYSVAWLGIEFKTSEGHWIDFDGAPIFYIPDGLSLNPEADSYAALTTANRGVTMGWVWAELCIFCEGKVGGHIYELRGLCQRPLHLHPRRDSSGVLYWHISGSGGLVLQLVNDKWRLKQWGGGSLVAQTSGEHLPMGRTHWDVYDTSICDGKALVDEGEAQPLSVGPCNESQFMCWEGQCVPDEARCSFFRDCLDGSDERDCHLARPRPGYQTTLPPPSPDFNLAIALTLKKISWGCAGVDVEAVRVDLVVRVRWRDGRLQYFNLQEDKGLNIVQPPTDQQIWRPTIQVMEEYRLAGSVPHVTRLLVSRDSPGHFTGFDTVYDGQDNDLALQVDVSADVYCHFDLWRFPFDIQICNLSLRLSDLPRQHSVYHPGRFNRDMDLCPESTALEFAITGCQLHLTNMSNIVTLTVTLSRRWSYHLWATYLPTALLHGIGYGTLAIATSDFQSRGIMSLTSLLVLIALYSDTLAGLPSSSFLRLLDVWLIFSVAFLASVIAVHMATNDPERPSAHPTLVRARKVLLFVYCLFNLVYWIVLATSK